MTDIPKRWFVYMVKCSDGSFYTGMTTDLKRRLSEHNRSPRGARYTRTRRPVRLVYSCSFPLRSGAAKREAYLKKLSHAEKRKWGGERTERTYARG